MRHRFLPDRARDRWWALAPIFLLITAAANRHWSEAIAWFTVSVLDWLYVKDEDQLRAIHRHVTDIHNRTVR